MNNQIDELMRLFDEAAEASFDQGLHRRTIDDAPEEKREEFRKALEAALKPGEPEFDDCAASPTGKHSESWFCNSNCTHCGTGAVDEPLYWHDTETDTPTAPPAQTPPRLTVSEIFEADPLPHSMFDDERVEFARAIESAVRAHFGVNDE